MEKKVYHQILWVVIFAFSCPCLENKLIITPRTDIPLLVGTATTSAGIALIRDERFVPMKFTGKAELINLVDRPIAGIHQPGLAIVSDLTLAATILASPVFLAFTHNKPNSIVDELFLVAESISLTHFLLQITKTAVNRPRPLMYAKNLPGKQRFRADNFLSFFSGHAATTFSFATSTTMLAAKSNTSMPLKAASAIVTFSLASVTSVLRVASGKHFITDVLSGAIIGAATSMVVIEAHGNDVINRDRAQNTSAVTFSFAIPVKNRLGY